MTHRSGSILVIGVVAAASLIGSTAAAMMSRLTSMPVGRWDNSAQEVLAMQRVKHQQFVAQELQCLAQNIYHEARGSTEQDMEAVAFVTLNRTTHRAWGGSVCQVVWEKAQFSWTLDRRLWKIQDLPSWEKSYRIAALVYAKQVADPTDGATHYHTAQIRPRWSAKGVEKIRVGAHIYMKMASGGR